MRKIIECSNLSYSYNSYIKNQGFAGTLRDFVSREKVSINAINELNLEIFEGDIIGLLGSNGAGKTTLIKLLVGILEPKGGNINAMGFNPFDRKKEFLKQIGVIFGQKSQLIWDLPPIDTLNMLKDIYDIDNIQFKENVNELLDILDIAHLKNTPVRKLSLGQRTKFELVCSLFYYPKIIFLDEPTIGLDINSQNRIHDFLIEMNKKRNTTIILTSHYMKDIEKLSKRIVFISKGKKYEDCLKEELIDKYKVNNTYILKSKSDDLPISVNKDIKVELVCENTYKITALNKDAVISSLNLSNIISIKEDVPDLEDIFAQMFLEAENENILSSNDKSSISGVKL